ncbi:MAG: ABC transporter ATP-binding protein [Akkermansiaceae bacterium]|nr:ABC transporter ATP-binding protein [Akkermansiaceae bacterium]
MMKRVLSFAKRFLMPHFRWLVITFITGLITAAVSGLGVPLMVKFVFPIVFYTGEGELPLLMQYIPSLQEMAPLTLLMLACASMPLIFAIRGVAMWANHVVVNVLGLRILESLRKTVFHHVQQLPIAYLEGQRKGDMVSRIVADTGNVQNVLSHVANDLVKQPITCICAFAAFMYLLFSTGSPEMAIVLVFIGLAAWPVISFGKRISARAKRAQAELGELNTVVQQNLETQREIRAYSLEEREIADFVSSSQAYKHNMTKLVKYQRIIIPIMETVTAIALAFLLVAGKSSGMGLEDFLALAAAMFFTFDSMKRAGQAFNRLNEAQGSLTRLEEVLAVENPIADPENPVTMPAKVKGELDFRNLTFAYDTGKPVLKDINIHIPAGQIVGLVGPSGAGKTTFASLIPRFYEATEGAVCIDGIDVRDVTLHDLREQLSVVGQQALLFSGTIRENIALGKTGATDEQIQSAAAAARVSAFLDNQPQGIDTPLGQGGAGLSGGQRQRVAIARAFVKDAPILILDEATASLDAESEREIQQELDKLAQGRTTLIVAHRFSTLRHAHRILVFEHGRIVGDGPHAELYDSCPLYKELFDRQGAV